MHMVQTLRRGNVTLPAQGAPRRTSTDGFRRDIQGLRAVAVLAVIADHVLGWPNGGFVGVDIFFVISGFLITGLLLREHERTGTISFMRFYARRARRILPAAVVVLITTVIAAAMLFPASRASNVAVDAFWSSVFLSNWHFADLGTDYFQQGLSTSPLQHFWSLSVEEQFYFVWPWLLLGVCALVGARGLRRRWPAADVAVVLISVISIASFAWGLHASSSNPTSSYFSTATRVWELGVGALVAALAGRVRRARPLPRRTLQAVGLAGLVVSFVMVDPGRQFPVPWALLPVLATAALIVAGLRGPGPRVLESAPAVYVGTISYSLYLWHFPLLVIAGALLPREGPLLTGLVLVSTALLAVASYHLVEKPVLDSPLLLPRTGPRRPAWRTWRRKTASGARIGVAAMATFGAVAIVAITVQAESARSFTGPLLDAADEIVATPDASSVTPLQDERSRDIAAALSARSFPALDPSIDDLDADAKVKQWSEEGCLGGERGSLPDVWANADRCTFGSGPRTAVLLGDSVAVSYAPALVGALDPKEWTTRIVTLQQCPVADVEVLAGGAPFDACDEFHDGLADYLRQSDIDLVVASQADSTAARLASGAKGADAVVELSEGLADTIGDLEPLGARWVILTAPPVTASLTDCATAIARPSDCVKRVSPTHTEANRVASVVATDPDLGNVEVINADRWFCARASSTCPAFIANTPTTVDGVHLTDGAARLLAPLLREALSTFP